MERLVRKNLQQVVLSSQSEDKFLNHPKLQLIWSATLYHMDDIPFNPGTLPDVYTQFRKASFMVANFVCLDRWEIAFSLIDVKLDETMTRSLLRLSA